MRLVAVRGPHLPLQHRRNFRQRPSRRAARAIAGSEAGDAAGIRSNGLKATALGILRAGELVLDRPGTWMYRFAGRGNPHVLTCTLRFLRSDDAQPAFARNAFKAFESSLSSEVTCNSDRIVCMQAFVV